MSAIGKSVGISIPCGFEWGNVTLPTNFAVAGMR